MNLDSSFYDYDYFESGNKSHYMGYTPTRVEKVRAEVVANVLNPKKVLEIGCAKGFIVLYLREVLQVDAYGIDISEYAISQADPRIKDYVQAIDITEGLPFKDKEFDWVVSWDVLEHIPEDKLPKVISELERVGQNQYHRIATETDETDKDKSHVTIKPIEWWRERLSGYLAGSSDPDDYDTEANLKPSQPLIDYLCQNCLGLHFYGKESKTTASD